MEWIERCLNSLESVTLAHEVFIIDNGSTDNTTEYIRKQYPNAIIKKNKDNLGFGLANNIGIKYALDNNFDYVYLINQDAWIKEGCIENLIKIQKKHPEFGILSPVQIQANEKNIDRNFNLHVCSYQANPNFINDLYFQNLKEVYEVPDIMAAHWLISKECFSKVGGFSPAFKQYGEDNNYCERTHYHGFKIGFVPKAIGIHDRGERKLTKVKYIYMRFYVEPRRILSSPYRIHKGLFLSCIKNMALYSITHLNWQTAKYFILLFKDLGRILRLRRTSICKNCAFINI